MTELPTGPVDGAMSGVVRMATDVDELERTTGLLVRTARELARDTEVATASLDRIADIPARQALVVVGETKKGKSSVVNALLGRPGTSPVAVEVATATYVVFRHGPDEAWVLRADGATERVELDNLVPWVSVEGLTANPRAPAADAAAPVSAYLDVELLRDVTIIDTPGVGGLVGAHNAATLDAIRLAGAMLLVTDISVPLTEPEAQFLRKVSETANLAEVIIVANKSDKLLADDVQTAQIAAKARIAEAIPALADAPFVVVAAARALRALEPGVMPQASRDRMRQVSGFDELERVIDMRVRQRSKVLIEGARLQLVHRAATTLVDAARARATMLSSDDADEQVNELQDRMIDLGHQVETARLTFANDLATLKTSLNTRLDSRFADLSNELLRMVKNHAPQT
ncbi:MAG: dynamin family protein, partial [Actinomycetota bacterium]|nr:dynamin family protein [Actinomycetota bacterium]